jgi:hypothetical protein
MEFNAKLMLFVGFFLSLEFQLRLWYVLKIFLMFMRRKVFIFGFKGENTPLVYDDRAIFVIWS